MHKSNDPDELPMRPPKAGMQGVFAMLHPILFPPAKRVTTAAVCSIRMLDYHINARLLSFAKFTKPPIVPFSYNQSEYGSPFLYKMISFLRFDSRH
jgi:hypothetical protein